MATEYVDPDYVGTSTGTIEQPWKTGADATIANDLTLLWKRGTTDVLSSDINTTHSNVTFGAYGNGTLPVLSSYITSTNTEDWSNPSGNIWTYTGPAVFDYLHLIALGSLPTDPRDHLQWHQRVNYRGWSSGTKTTFDTDGEWDTDGANPSILYLYAPQNPVTEWGTIYISGQNTNECIRVDSGGTNILAENLNFRFAGRGFNARAGTSDITVQDCIFEFCYDAIAFGGCDGIIAQRNDIYTSSRAAIRPGDNTSSTKPSYIRNNTITDTGYGEGIGHIYGGAEFPNHATGLKVFNNICNRSHEGIYWATEGYGIYAESTSAYWEIVGNIVKNQRNAIGDRAAYHSNGGIGNKWVSNICYNCSNGFNGSDSLPTDNVQEEVYNNIFIGVNIAFAFSRKPLVGGEVFQYEIYNNIVTVNLDNPSTTYGVIVDPDVDDLDTMTIDYNIFYGFDINIARLPDGTLNTELGPNTITVDPQIDSSGIPDPYGPCYAAGIPVSFSARDFNGKKFKTPPDIGAYSRASMPAKDREVAI